MSTSRVVVITGASAGVGRATVLKFAQEKARIALIARNPEALENAKKEAEALGAEAMVLPVDISDSQKVFAAAAQIEARWGKIDVWVNNAMVSVFSPVHEMLPEEYQRVTEVTYLGAVYGTLAALKGMRQKNSGLIIQVGSALAYRAIPLQSAYCAAKHALSGFSESLRCELLHEKSAVQVCSVHMPALNTPQFEWVKSRLPGHPQPVPPIFQPELAAEAIYHMSLHPKREMWVAFPTWKAILGDKFAPGFADWYLSRNGYEAQQMKKTVDPDRPNNLWDYVPGDKGAHGIFDKNAKPTSGLFAITRTPLVSGAVAATLVLLVAILVGGAF